MSVCMGFLTTASTFSLLSEIAKLSLNARARARVSIRVRIPRRVLVVGRVLIRVKILLTYDLIYMMSGIQTGIVFRSLILHSYSLDFLIIEVI